MSSGRKESWPFTARRKSSRRVPEATDRSWLAECHLQAAGVKVANPAPDEASTATAPNAASVQHRRPARSAAPISQEGSLKRQPGGRDGKDRSTGEAGAERRVIRGQADPAAA